MTAFWSIYVLIAFFLLCTCPGQFVVSLYFSDYVFKHSFSIFFLIFVKQSTLINFNVIIFDVRKYCFVDIIILLMKEYAIYMTFIWIKITSQKAIILTTKIYADKVGRNFDKDFTEWSRVVVCTEYKNCNETTKQSSKTNQFIKYWHQGNHISYQK